MADYDWDPVEELKRIERRLGGMISGRSETVDVARQGLVNTPSVDVVERGNDIIVTADMPGVEKGDIKLNVREDNVLEISAEKKMESKIEEKGFIRHERGYNRYYRAVRLPVPVDKAGAKASYNNGVLEVRLPMIHKTSTSDIPIS